MTILIFFWIYDYLVNTHRAHARGMGGMLVALRRINNSPNYRTATMRYSFINSFFVNDLECLAIKSDVARCSKSFHHYILLHQYRMHTYML